MTNEPLLPWAVITAIFVIWCWKHRDTGEIK